MHLRMRGLQRLRGQKEELTPREQGSGGNREMKANTEKERKRGRYFRSDVFKRLFLSYTLIIVAVFGEVVFDLFHPGKFGIGIQHQDLA